MITLAGLDQMVLTQIQLEFDSSQHQATLPDRWESGLFLLLFFGESHSPPQQFSHSQEHQVTVSQLTVVSMAASSLKTHGLGLLIRLGQSSGAESLF